MSTFTESDVANLAQVACISLTEEELRGFAEDLQNITRTMRDLREMDMEDVIPTYHPVPLVNVVREDRVTGTLNRDELLAAAPEEQDGQFMVPRILGED